MPLKIIKQENEDSEKQVNNLYKLFLTSILLFVFGFAKSQQQQKYTIENITVSGAKFLSPKTIISNSGLEIGDEITIPGIEISNAVKNIWSESLVGNVSISATETNGDLISLNIHLTERSRLSQIHINGVRKGEEKDLKESFDVVTSQVVSEALKKNIGLQIEKHFRENGFYQVNVSDPTEKTDTSVRNHVSLTYNVTKGEKYKIDEIRIAGDKQIAEKKLKRKMKNTKEKAWWRFWHRSKFIQEEYNTDEQTLVDLYRSKGLRDATINLDSVYVNPEEDETVKLDIKIDEGKVYYFRDIIWTGNSKYSDKQLNRILGIQKGDLYNQTELDSKLNFNPTGVDVSSLYLDDGYLFFSVTPNELRVDGDSIDIEMRIYEGNQATIGNVKVFGNTKTSDHVIMREIRTLPGDKFSRSNLIRSQQIIASLGYFDPEQIQIIPTPNPKTGTVDIEYRVVEKPSDQLTLSGGWGGGGGIGFVGTLGLVFNNFSLRNVSKPKTWDPLPSGDGQRLSIQAQANGRLFQNYSLSFTEPWLGGKKPNAFTTSLNHSVYGRLGNSVTGTVDGNMTITGASVGISRRLRKIDDYFTLSNSLSYSLYNIDNFTFNSTDPLCTKCKANNLTFNTVIARNSSGPNIQYPTEGSNISLSLALTPPYSLLSNAVANRTGEETYKLVEYNKWLFDFTSYLRLGTRKNRDKLGVKSKKDRPFVLQTRYHFGYIGKYNDQYELGPFERFRVGGTGINNFNFVLGTEIVSLRGYDDNALFPENGGGVVFNKLSWELRYPFVTEGIATIYGFGFFEAGNNWGNAKDFNPLDLKRSAGGGLNIFMPAFGNISLGYGWGLDQTPLNNGIATNGGRFLFSIGTIIR